MTTQGPTLQGVGGLKLVPADLSEKGRASHPARGGWIEMAQVSVLAASTRVPPCEGWVD